MDPFATIEDLEARWRPLVGSEIARAETLLTDASQLIVDLYSGELPQSKEPAVKRVVCEMVKRAMLSPIDQAPLKTFQQMAGPYQEMQTFANPTGDLYLTSSEKKQLGIGRQKMGSIRGAIHNCKGGDIDGW